MPRNQQYTRQVAFGRGVENEMTPAQSFVVVSGKGGVGKTTCVANLGCALSVAGFRVALVDADIGLRNLDVALGLETKVVYDLVDVIEGRCGLEQALVRHPQLEDLWLLPAAQARDKSEVSAEQIGEVVQALKRGFEFVLVDSPAGIEQGFRNALSGAERAIIVTTPEMAAIRDADRVAGLLRARMSDPSYLIVNRVRPQLVTRGEMMDADDIAEIVGAELIGVIPEDESVLIATNRGRPVVLAQNSDASRAFKNTALRIRGEHVSYAKFGEQPSFFERVFGRLGFR